MINTFKGIESVTIPGDRRRAIQRILDANRGYLLTDILLIESRQLQTQVLEVINGIIVEGGIPRQESFDARPERFTLRALGGPYKIKVGMEGMTTREERALVMRGESPYRYREFDGTFDVTAEMGTYLLKNFGYGFFHPRYMCRHAANTGEKDCQGSQIKPTDRWLFVEVGSQMEDRAKRNGDLKDGHPSKKRN